MEGREPVRVLRLIARLNMGGPALHVSYLARGLAERGYETMLGAGSLRAGRGLDGVRAGLARRRGRRREAPAARAFGRCGSACVPRDPDLIRRFRPHILHTHTAKAGAIGRAAARVAGAARPPIIVHTFHGHVLRGYFDPVRTAAYTRVERDLARMTTRLVAVSPEVRDELVGLGVAPVEKFTVIRLGIDLDSRIVRGEGDGAELRRLFGVPPETFVVGWIGRMTAIKHLPDVLGAFALLRERGVDARLCLVGDGPDRELVERRAHELGIAREILFVGYQQDVAPYYGLFDALLLPSGNEGTPVVAIESLAAGTPVVATAVGGVPDVVENGTDGFLAPVGDVEALAGALERLARNPELRAEMGRAGRARTLPRYRVDRLVDDVDALYRVLLAERGLPLPGG